MTDDLEKLRAALKATTPAADPAAKAAALARAMENFDRAQEQAPAPRPKSDRPDRAGLLTGVRDMISRMNPRPGLWATASIAALFGGLVIVLPSLQGLPPSAGISDDKASGAIAPSAAENPASSTSSNLTAQQEATVAGDAAKKASEPAGIVATTAAPAAAPARSSNAIQLPEAKLDKDQALGADAQFAAPADTLTASPLSDSATVAAPGTEAFANADPNPVKIATEQPVSTFSIDVDTASYSLVRSSLNAGALPPPEAVRIEEMVNYFPYAYPAPTAGGAPFATSFSLFQTPWNKDTELLRIGIQGRFPATADRPPLNLVFLIDTSGSMDEPNKLPLLVQSFRLMVGQLRPEDRVAIVTYAGSAGLVLQPTPASDKAAILSALGRLAAGGSTAGAEGLELAYQTAEGMAANGRVGRIILATDGDFNVGVSDPDGLEAYVAKKRESGTYLSVLGFGRGNLDDQIMQTLAQNGNGTAAYIDTMSEAQKVLADQLTGALFPIADDVKIQIEFNPAAVAEYRLIGYETRLLAREDFNNDRVDAGEVGAGRQVTALYEIVPVGSPARLSDPLRYAAKPAEPMAATELGFLKLRYKEPGTDQSKLIETAIAAAPTAADDDARFAAAIAGMGQLLSDPKYLGKWGWADAVALANGARGADPFGYRTEAVQNMRLAQSLAR